jgi:hypothetical protein
MKILIVTLIVIMSIFITSCFAVAPPVVKILPTEKIALVEKTYGKYADTAIPGWFTGIVYEVNYREAYGWRSDPYNEVIAYVYLPKSTVALEPWDGWEEEEFVKRIQPGDIVQFRLLDSNGYWLESLPAGRYPFNVRLQNIIVVGHME